MQALIEDQYCSDDDQTAFNAKYSDIAGQYLTDNSNGTLGDSGAYALMTLFGSTINVYFAPAGSTTYTPLTITTNPNGSQTITKINCAH